jgi:hypothetical protein
MSGLYFLGSIIAVFIVFVWFIRNDKVPADQQTTGLLAMKLPDPNAPPLKKKRRPWSREAG